MRKSLVKTSKFLSLVLRHKPETIDLKLDHGGWACVDELKQKSASAKVQLTDEILTEIVETNDKRRFIFSVDGRRIRANQGHSISVDLGLTPISPPSNLFHGTAIRFLTSIRKSGLISGNRQYVHLSDNRTTAEKVGQRHGRVVVLRIDSKSMSKDGFFFFRSENNVWLIDRVPAKYLIYPETIYPRFGS